MMEEKQDIEFENIWARYGLKDSPYNTKALSLIGSFDIEQVFCGRSNELRLLGNRIHSSESSRTAVIGEVGTGKTTFANYLRWSLTRKNTKESKFLTIVDEIKAKPDWDYKEFLRITLFDIYNSSTIFKWEEGGIRLEALQKIKENLDLFSRRSIEIRREDITLKKESASVPNQIPFELLSLWFRELCKEIQSYNKKLILHYNNLECLSSEKLTSLFMSIKEILQTEDTHWLFLGPAETISTIESAPQIHSIFNEHIILSPLSDNEVIEILEKRCKFLSTKGLAYSRPYDENTVRELHKKLNGNIRFIFKLLEDTTSMLPSPSSQITINEINAVQEREKEKILSKLNLNQQKILALLIERGEITLTELAEGTGIQQTNLQKDLRELVAKTFVTIRENPEDRRSKLARLSQKTYLSFIFSQKQP